MVKTEFSIKDLENLSNVKAHTIRIWEKRYNLLEPDRTDTNIRRYDLENLKKLLNIAYLYRSGYKISKLAEMENSEIQALITENRDNLDSNYALEVFKTIMIEFDGNRFDETLKQLLGKQGFRQVFTEIFVPLLTETGVLWHTGTFDPSHEHFISEKIKHAIIFQSKKIKHTRTQGPTTTFALYLPLGEIHEIGLLYANYELLLAGFDTLYLGSNVPLSSLKHVLNQKKHLHFVTYFTVHPEIENINSYIQNFKDTVCPKYDCNLWILGDRGDNTSISSANVKVFKNIPSFVSELQDIE